VGFTGCTEEEKAKIEEQKAALEPLCRLIKDILSDKVRYSTHGCQLVTPSVSKVPCHGMPSFCGMPPAWTVSSDHCATKHALAFT